MQCMLEIYVKCLNLWFNFALIKIAKKKKKIVFSSDYTKMHSKITKILNLTWQYI